MFGQGFSFSGYERDPLYLNLGGKKFTDISGVSGIDSITDGRAGVFADFDNDGDLDVFSTTIQHQSHLLFRNNVGQDNNYLRIGLEGDAKTGLDAFGAVVRVKTSAGILTKIKSGGSGFISQHDSAFYSDSAKINKPNQSKLLGQTAKSNDLKLMPRTARRCF